MCRCSAGAAQPAVAAALIAARDAAVAARVAKGGRADDFEAVAGETYLACKDQLKLSKPGNTAKAFMRDTLAALVTPETETFKQLRTDIFGA